MQPWLTIAMATYEDFYGVDATLFGLRMYQNLEGVEIIVLDNAPDTVHGAETKAICAISGVKYIPYTENTGTTQTRQRLFDNASGELVLVMDCHVFLVQGAIDKLKAYWDAASPEDKKNLYTGPLLMDSMQQQCSHFECEWRSQMWGTWATAWRTPEGAMMVGKNIEGTLHMKHMNTEGPWMQSGIPWPGHEAQLRAKGWVVAGWDDEIPFEVPAQGLGLFMSSKEHWLGFNPDFRHFGGEECYIHTKYRQAGRKTVCLPFLKWRHRFGRPGGPTYPITAEAKLRNYILGFQELGMDLEPVRQHFVDEVKLRPEVYALILENPKDFDPYNNKANSQAPNTAPQNMKPQYKSNMGLDLPFVAENLHSMALHVASLPRDLNEHAGVMMDFASRCSSILEITKRRESTMFLLAGLTRKQACAQKQCQKDGCQGVCKRENVDLDSFQSERDSLLDLIKEAIPSSPGKPVTYRDTVYDHQAVPVIDRRYDMLYIDSMHTKAKLEEQLALALSIDKYIMLRGTAGSGEKGEDGGLGLYAAIRPFLKANPEWFIIEQWNQQYGMMLLGKDPTEKPEHDIRPWLPSLANGERCGVGSEIKKSLAFFGITATDSCPCNALAKKYDYEGPQWCRDHIDEILDALHQQAIARKKEFMFVRSAAKLMVMRSIRAAEKQIKCGDCA
jgi:hypothetical protein